MTALTLALTPLLALQSAAETAVAVRNDNPETWIIEYPLLIQPHVQDYRRCLKLVNRTMSGKADFEEQHRSDIPRCAEAREQAVAASIAELSGAKTPMSAGEINQLFDDIGKVHIARGADLDKQFTLTLQRSQQARDDYEASKPKGLVLELRDASVVKARTDATAPKSDEGSK